MGNSISVIFFHQSRFTSRTGKYQIVRNISLAVKFQRAAVHMQIVRIYFRDESGFIVSRHPAVHNKGSGRAFYGNIPFGDHIPGIFHRQRTSRLNDKSSRFTVFLHSRINAAVNNGSSAVPDSRNPRISNQRIVI